jgi:tripartite-type tricarboxylate transporter receptor subunit TctC
MRLIFGLFLILSLVTHGHAQERPIRVVVGLPPSSTFPVIVRSITNNVSDKSLVFVIDYKVGQGNLLAYQHAANAKPDGRTLVFTSTSVVVNPLLHQDAGYHYTDFEPVVFIGKVPSSILVNSRTPFYSIKDLVAYAKKQPNNLMYGHNGFATQSFLAMELIAHRTNTLFQNIAYKDSNIAFLDMASGNIDLAMVVLGRTQGYLSTNKVRLIATTGTSREKQFPNTPVVAETLPGFESYVHYAIQAPRGVLPEILERLRQELTVGLRSEVTQKLLENVGIQYQDLTPAESREFFRKEFERWSTVIRARNINAK